MAPGEFVLRVCELGDLDAVTDIEKASFPLRPYKKRDFAYFLLAARKGFVVACRDGSVVGYVVATTHGGEGWIQSVAVAPGFRRRGVGEMLMRSAVEHFHGRSGRVYLLVSASNPAARGLYGKLEFRETGRTIDGYYPNGDDAIEMAREL
jgi:[ribosomal protein S18]-alanine N-acetyltransferase